LGVNELNTKSKKIRALSLPLSILLVSVPVLFNSESANAAPKVVKPSISVVQTSAGKSAITVNVGTKYAGKSLAISRSSNSSLQSQSNVIITVKIGTNGKAIAVTSSSIKKGNVLSATIGTKLFVKSTISKIRIVAKLPKSSPVVKPVTTAITFSSLAANGTSNLTTTTALTLAFSADVTGLTAADLTLTGATKGALTRTSTGVYTLGVSGITVANGSNLTVAVAKTGFIFTPSSRTVAANVSTSTFSFNSLTANGTSGSVSTTILTLIFSGDITGLSAADLTVVGATKGTLTKTGIGTYTLGVSGITVANGANLTVAAAKPGFIFTPSSRTVAANVSTSAISFDSLSANGTSGSVATTTLTLFFSADVTGLTATDITVTGGTKGALTRIGTGVYNLGISALTVTNGANITVTVAKTGFTFTPSSRSVAANVATNMISFDSLSANGTSGSVSTTNLTLFFGADVAGLTTADITVTGATEGALTRIGTGVYSLGVSGITVANGSNLTVTVAKPGFTFTPSSRSVAAKVATSTISFNALTANGESGSVSTTLLTMVFSADVAGLSASDIIIDGASRGTLTRTSAGVYTLGVSSITVANGGNITVAVSKSGFVFTPSIKTVTANVLTRAINFTSLTANGTGGSVSTTVLTLTFSADVTGLASTDITVIGATKGSLTRTGTGVYNLSISSISVADGAELTVGVSKVGYVFTPSNQTVAAKVLTRAIDIISIDANGTSNSVSTTALTLTFSADVPGLSASNITLIGATKAALTSVGGGVYTLGITGITVMNGANLTVSVSKPGFSFEPASVSVAANVAPTPVTFSSVAANGASATQTTTLLTLTFSRDITGLSAGDFTVTGATTGVLTRTGTGTYTLAISAIAVANGATVTVDVSKPGFTITPASLTAAVNVAS